MKGGAKRRLNFLNTAEILQELDSDNEDKENQKIESKKVTNCCPDSALSEDKDIKSNPVSVLKRSPRPTINSILKFYDDESSERIRDRRSRKVKFSGK